MRDWSAERVARAAGARLLAGAAVTEGPRRAVLDDRALAPGELFVGLGGTRVDGGRFAGAALSAGAWGVLVSEQHGASLVAAGAANAAPERRAQAILVAEDPLRALQRLATAWRRELAASVVAVTGSTGKTSTKDIVAALLAGTLPTVASPLNLNTDIGLPLAILAAPAGTRALVLEMGMRGMGEIAELAAIAEPDVGVIVNVGPAHLERLGSLEAVAAAKAELIAGLRPGATAVVPAHESLLAPHLREDVRTIDFGIGGAVSLEAGPEPVAGEAERWRVAIATPRGRRELVIGFRATHQLANMLAAVAVAEALEVPLPTQLEVAFSAGRGKPIELASGVVVIDDCYNANPMSMLAALEDLTATARGRRVAVLGDMLELGAAELDFHRELGAQARSAKVDLLVTVGRRAAATGEAFMQAGGLTHHHAVDAEAAARLVPALLIDGDTVLVKASRAIALEAVTQAITTARG